MGVTEAGVATEIPVDHPSAVHLAARAARTIATTVGLPGAIPDKAAVVASELASNLDKHAWDGTVYVQPLLAGAGVDVTAVDRGPGMTDVEPCLGDGHTTAGTLGVGLGAVRRMATDFSIASTPGEGTLVNARLRRPADDTPARVDLGHLVLPANGEEHSGDAVAAAPTESGWTLLVADGLGHGTPAAEAAGEAVHAFHQDPARPLPALMTALHRALRPTRGAAVALLRVQAGHVGFCGIGNIRAVVLTGTRTRHLVSTPGVVGLRVDSPTQHDLDTPPGSVAVVHSDGLDGAWALGPPAHTDASVQLLAARLLRDHRRPRDDAGVLVTRVPGSAA